MDKSTRPLQFHMALFIMNELITNFTDTSHSSGYLYEMYLVSSTCILSNFCESHQFTGLAH